MSPIVLPSPAALHRAVTERIAIDVRALAAFRVGLGATILLDLALRSRSLVAFYTDDGILTSGLLADIYPTYASLSLHAFSGEAWWQVVLFVLAGGFAVAMVVGYRTRLATVASLVLLVSLHARNPTVLNAGDVLLRRLLFWGGLLPLGRRWSVDTLRSAARPSGSKATSTVANLASLGLILQVVLVYVVNAHSKLGSEQWFGGHAVASLLSLEGYAVGLAPVVTAIPALPTVLTYLWLGLLFASWLLLVTTGRVRGVLAATFLALHLGMLTTLDLAIFPLVSLAALLPFLPTSVWDRIERIAGRIRERVSTASPAIGRADDPSRRSSPESAVDRSNDPSRFARPTLHATFLVVLLLANAVAVGLVPVPDGTPDELTDDTWGMFARPPAVDGWTVADGRLRSGERVEALRNVRGLQDRPPDVDRYPNARWRKHLSRYPTRPALSPALGEYVCQRWRSDADGDTLQTVTIRRVYDRGEGQEPQHHNLGKFRCTDTGATPIDGDER